MPHIDLYYTEKCPFSRSVILTAKAVGLDLNMKKVDLQKGEQLEPEFLALTPEHCVPVIVDGPLTIPESRAICTYLISKYAKGDELYPKDPVQRAHIDRLLYFDMGMISQPLGEYLEPFLQGSVDKPDEEKLDKLQEAFGFLNRYLKGQFFATGSNITVADFVLVSTIETINACGIDISKHKNVKAWLNRCRNHMKDYDECVVTGAIKLGDEFKAKLAEKKH